MKTMRAIGTGVGLGVLLLGAGASPSYGQPAGSVAPAAVAAAPAYVWPTEASPEPKDDDWAGATLLGTDRVAMDTRSWGGTEGVSCSKRALRDWVRVTCTPPHDGVSDVLFGVLWAMAGDVSAVKAKFALASELEKYKLPPSDFVSDLTRKMGASATVTFRVSPGGAFVLSLDHIGWDESYDGGMTMFSLPGMLIDVSWALGEAQPTIAYR